MKVLGHLLPKPQIWMMLAVIFFYRFGEGFIEKFGPLFLLDARRLGGLVWAMKRWANGSVGTISLSSLAPSRRFPAAKR